MSKQSFTPGPWAWHGDELLSPGAFVLSTSCRPERANANLIAAAPDLLEALVAYMSQFGQGLESHGIPFGPAQEDADRQAREAIAKALGDQP